VYNSWRICQAQDNGFLNNSYIRYQTLEEAKQEFNQFLVDEAMAYEGMVVQAVLLAQGMTLQALHVQGMPMQVMPLQAMAVQAMSHHNGHMFRDSIIVALLVVIAKLLFFT
jgi:hypothetical protein